MPARALAEAFHHAAELLELRLLVGVEQAGELVVQVLARRLQRLPVGAQLLDELADRGVRGVGVVEHVVETAAQLALLLEDRARLVALRLEELAGALALRIGELEVVGETPAGEDPRPSGATEG